MPKIIMAETAWRYAIERSDNLNKYMELIYRKIRYNAINGSTRMLLWSDQDKDFEGMPLPNADQRIILVHKLRELGYKIKYQNITKTETWVSWVPKNNG